MKITINQPESFKIYRGQIGIVLFTSDEYSHFYQTNGDHVRARNESLQTLRNDFLLEELLENEDLREIADHYDIIDVCKFDRVGYMNYINIFN